MEGWENQNVFFRWAFPWIQYSFHDLSNETMRFPQFSINVQSWNKYVRFLQSSSIDLTFSILFASKTAVTLIGEEASSASVRASWEGVIGLRLSIAAESVNRSVGQGHYPCGCGPRVRGRNDFFSDEIIARSISGEFKRGGFDFEKSYTGIILKHENNHFACHN